jgi:Coenzyme PQQ synthesis protein D (PqqD).
MAKQGENYLDYVPVRNPHNTWEEKDGKVVIHMAHTGIYDRVAQKFFHTPRVSHIDLDAYGSFLWNEIDGTRTVGELAERMRTRFGQDAEPLYDRLVKYMQILRNNRFIFIRGKDKVKV